MKKGQIMSLDLIIALVTIILALGLLFQLSETRVYAQKEGILQAELESIGRTASIRLVSNPQITCPLVDASSSTISFLENCLDIAKINQSTLGIPSGHGFAVFEKGNAVPVAGIAIPAAPAPENVFAETRVVVTHTGNLTKSDYEICMGNKAGACTLAKKELTIAVWRS